MEKVDTDSVIEYPTTEVKNISTEFSEDVQVRTVKALIRNLKE